MSNVNFTKELNLWPGLVGYLPTIVAQGNPNQTHAAASTVDVTGASITVPKGHFGPGTGFRFTLAGSRTGTAGAATLLIDINGTTAITIAVPTNTAEDRAAILQERCGAGERLAGKHGGEIEQMRAKDPEVERAAALVFLAARADFQHATDGLLLNQPGQRLSEIGHG